MVIGAYIINSQVHSPPRPHAVSLLAGRPGVLDLGVQSRKYNMLENCFELTLTNVSSSSIECDLAADDEDRSEPRYQFALAGRWASQSLTIAPRETRILVFDWSDSGHWLISEGKNLFPVGRIPRKVTVRTKGERWEWGIDPNPKE